MSEISSKISTLPTVLRVIDRHALRYTAGADAATDRPAHVRAGSACCFVDVPNKGRRLAVVQDDANFIALVDVAHPGDVDVVVLPAGVGGLRQFDSGRGNKQHKLDLESALALDIDGVPTLFALGSGSAPAREVVVVVRFVGERVDVRVVALPLLFSLLKARRDFAGDELNIEGMVVVDDVLRLVNRGNGAGVAVDAMIDVPLAAFVAHVADPSSTPPPTPGVCRAFVLGAVSGVRLTLTDATRARDGRIVVLAAAEASPNAVDDGEVVGTAVGIFNSDEAPTMYALLDEHGEPLRDKVEGIALDPVDRDIAWVVVDKDDPHAPADVLRVDLAGVLR
jgi:hypothetical protein